MEIQHDTIKITMTKTEVERLRREILDVLNDNPMVAEESSRAAYPKINEFIKILEIDLEKIPF